VFAVGWLCERRRRPQEAAGHGRWEPSWAVYFSPQGGARNAIIEVIRNAKQTILVQAYLLYSKRLAGACVRAHQRGAQVHELLDAHAQPYQPPSRLSHTWWRWESIYRSMRGMHRHTIRSLSS
jgi:phosphatidylserine/phosphatidylglycerophosphate/cardiolipin synthase-like enzyme